MPEKSGTRGDAGAGAANAAAQRASAAGTARAILTPGLLNSRLLAALKGDECKLQLSDKAAVLQRCLVRDRSYSEVVFDTVIEDHSTSRLRHYEHGWPLARVRIGGVINGESDA